MKSKSLFVSSLIFLILFILIAINLNNSSLINIDNTINTWSANSQNELMQIFCILLSKIFEPIYVIIFVILLSLFLLVKSKNKQAILLSTTALIAGASIYLLKHLFSKARPLNQIIQETGFSFPSGHAMISITLFGTLIYIALNIKSQTSRIVSIVACVLGVLLVGLSRVYLNVHWFSDIIGSYCFGLFILFIVLFGEKIWKQL